MDLGVEVVDDRLVTRMRLIGSQNRQGSPEEEARDAGVSPTSYGRRNQIQGHGGGLRASPHYFRSQSPRRCSSVRHGCLRQLQERRPPWPRTQVASPAVDPPVVLSSSASICFDPPVFCRVQIPSALGRINHVVLVLFVVLVEWIGDLAPTAYFLLLEIALIHLHILQGLEFFFMFFMFAGQQFLLAMEDGYGFGYE
ncbi:hypothetical protein LINGRAHAP2_LOCUS13886 [Linum grandiflorum]